MSARTAAARVAQAWVALRSDDPEAVSAFAIARARMPSGRRLRGLRRMRLFELHGALPPPAKLTDLLHRSTQFYNPHKETCAVRTRPEGLAEVGASGWVALVVDRDGGRRSAAERWWQHETGEAVEVREALAWVMDFETVIDEASVEDLTVLRDRRHGLLCNPHAQRWALSGANVPLPWIPGAPDSGAARGTKGKA